MITDRENIQKFNKPRLSFQPKKFNKIKKLLVAIKIIGLGGAGKFDIFSILFFHDFPTTPHLPPHRIS
jgi:hypothetical protein